MSHSKAVIGGSFGAAIASLLVAESPVSAAIVDLTINPAVLSFPGSGNILLTNTATGGPGGFFQFNDGLGKTMGSNVNGISFFAGPLAYGAPITAAGVVSSFVRLSASATGTVTFGFRTPANEVGWFRMNLGGSGGAITYLAAAWNNTPGESILAGQTAVPEPTSLALVGLAALAVGAGYVRQRRQSAKSAQTV